MSTEESISLQPPSFSLHPFLLLDEFLASLSALPRASEGNTNHDPGESDEPKNDSTLQNTTAKSKELDERFDRILRVADFLCGGSILEAALAVLDSANSVRRIHANPSKRTAFIVKGMSSSRGRSGYSSDYYFCLLPQEPSGCYCSCRSYFERAKHDPQALCKHLLALKLMPYLECSCHEETVSDNEYSTFLMEVVFS